MSFFRLRVLRAPINRSVTSARPIGAPRSFQSCSILAVGKESAVHEEGRAEKVEAHKQDQLEKAKTGRGEWKDELASDSESIVKADRGDLKDTKGTIAELQKETAKAAQQENIDEMKKGPS